jgi:hypothetical protein
MVPILGGQPRRPVLPHGRAPACRLKVRGHRPCVIWSAPATMAAIVHRSAGHRALLGLTVERGHRRGGIVYLCARKWP